MCRVVIVNQNEAVVQLLNGKVIRLWSGHGQIRLLVLEFLKPISVAHNFPLGVSVPGDWAEDTVKIAG